LVLLSPVRPRGGSAEEGREHETYGHLLILANPHEVRAAHWLLR
jgi:hypothetical protein